MEQVGEKVEEALHLDHPSHQHGGLPSITADLENPSQDVNATNRDSDYTLVELEKETLAKETDGRISSERASIDRSHLGVDVIGAEKEFAELQRELSNVSRKLSRQQSRRSERQKVHDVEKAVSHETSEEAEPFDLEDTLRGNKQMEEEAGIKSKHIGVIWEKLTVKGMGGSKIFVPTFPDACTGFVLFPFRLALRLLSRGRKGQEVHILRDFKGVVKPGEMVLVLGKPGSGCTTFLKVIANQRVGYTGIEGDVLYGPFASKEFEERYRGEAVYCQEDDIHRR